MFLNTPFTYSALPSGHKARGNDFATQSAHYTAHHLHITWTDSTHWSLSKMFYTAQWECFMETIKRIPCEDHFQRSELYYSTSAEGVYSSSSLSCSVVSVCLKEKDSNQHLCMLSTSFFTASVLALLEKQAVQQVLRGSSGRLRLIKLKCAILCWRWSTLWCRRHFYI